MVLNLFCTLKSHGELHISKASAITPIRSLRVDPAWACLKLPRWSQLAAKWAPLWFESHWFLGEGTLLEGIQFFGRNHEVLGYSRVPEEGTHTHLKNFYLNFPSPVSKFQSFPHLSPGNTELPFSGSPLRGLSVSFPRLSWFSPKTLQIHSSLHFMDLETEAQSQRVLSEPHSWLASERADQFPESLSMSLSHVLLQGNASV